tara:strand:+ start:1454 stop:1648 length:195 start_codon:yes stop_codon:yes gene_type:complete
MSKKYKYKLKKSEYIVLAECISSDQVPAEDIVEYFKDKKFKKFYEEEYINPYARPEEEDLPTLH